MGVEEEFKREVGWLVGWLVGAWEWEWEWEHLLWIPKIM